MATVTHSLAPLSAGVRTDTIRDTVIRRTPWDPVGKVLGSQDPGRRPVR